MCGRSEFGSPIETSAIARALGTIPHDEQPYACRRIVMNLTRNFSWKTKLLALAVGLLAGFIAWHSSGLGARSVSANANGAPAPATVIGATLTVNSNADN